MDNLEEQKSSINETLSHFLRRALSEIKTFFSLIYHNKKAFAGFIILMIFVIFAIFGRHIFPYDSATNYENRFAPMSFKHPFGTDNMGRDLFRMMVYGTRDVLLIALYAAVITVLIGATVGLVSGLIGGWVDRILQVITNLFMTIPSFPVLLVIASLVTIESNISFALVLSVFGWGGLARSIRAQIISIKERDFIQICKVMRISKVKIIFGELMPNVMSFILTNFILIMRGAITGSVGIMLLGLAVFEPTNWGSILLSAKDLGALNMPEARLFLFTPIIFIMAFQMGAILLSSGLDEAINPRLRKN